MPLGAAGDALHSVAPGQACQATWRQLLKHGPCLIHDEYGVCYQSLMQGPAQWTFAPLWVGCATKLEGRGGEGIIGAPMMIIIASQSWC